MSGNGKSPAEKLIKFKGKISDRCEQLSVPISKCRQIDHYINMSRSELRNLSDTDLSEIVWELQAYAYYLQDIINHHKMIVEHCKYNIYKTIGNTIREYNDIYGQEAKLNAAIADNQYAREWKEIEHNNQMMVEQLKYKAEGLDRIAQAIIEVKRSRRKFE